ncbi:hypothetical protein V5O48_017674 [Marasmius crinis-equi]|uniref:Uncharacterized protein n=1 Tax=Marasmius crinis-equi TaxID=585013 RepID=A0ABR3ENB4_9AGAR
MEEGEPIAVLSAVAPLHAPTLTEWLRNTATNKNIRFVPPGAPPSHIPSTRPKSPLQSRPLTPVKNPNRARRIVISADDLEFKGEVMEKVSSKDFLKKAEEFSSREVAKATESERRKELLVLRLKTEELGKKDKDSKQWSHNAFADTLLEYKQAAGIAETSTGILSIHSTMPRILRKLVKDSAKTWTNFTNAIKALDIEDIKREKETEDRLMGLERVSSTRIASETISTLSNQQQRYTPQSRADPFSSPSRGRENLFQRQVAQQTATLRLAEEQKNVLKANIRNYTQQLNTEEGEARWLVELVVFGKKWGKVLFSQDIVYPYRPGAYHWAWENASDVGRCFTPLAEDYVK